jgi:hypothetical protein
MKRFVLAAIALLALFCPLCSGQNEDLSLWYDEYNKDYFSNRLPHNVIIDYSQIGSYNGSDDPNGRRPVSHCFQ